MKLFIRSRDAAEIVRVFFINLLYFYLLIIKTKRCVKSINGTKRILLINTGDFGDNVIGFRFINTLLLSNEYQVHILTKYEYCELYRNFSQGLIVICWNKTRYKLNIFYKINFLSEIRKRNFDIVFNITPERGVLNEELVLFSGGSELWKVNKKDTFIRNSFKNLLDKKYHYNYLCNGINEYDILESASEILGLKTPRTKDILKKTHPRKNICLAPFSSDVKRNWDLKNYQTLINDLSIEHNVFILGALKSSDLLDIKNGKGINLIGKTKIKDLFQKLQNTDLFIGNDSGLTHLALYLNVPLIAIIGGGMFQRFFPFNEGKNNHYIYHKMDCFGCRWKCRYTERYCITNVKTEEVLKTAYCILGIQWL